jgi:acetylornithine/succinyldiaminopimelate/putrescine aminotransferase
LSRPATAAEVAPEEVASLLPHRRIHFDHYGHEPLPFAGVRASGIEMELADLGHGGELIGVLDASGGYGSASLGAGHPVVRAAMERALGDAGYVTDELGSVHRARLLGRLFGADGLWCDHFPAGEYRVSGRNSGSEGMELALRLVLESRYDLRRLRYRPGKARRDTILAFEGAWHGWSGGLLPLLNRRHFRAGLPGPAPLEDCGVRVEHVPFGDDAALDEYFEANAHRLLAVVVEPIQGDAGILPPPPGYLRRLAGRCAGERVLLVADEVLTFAKTGRFFAMADETGPVPTDITVIGKGLGMGAVSTSMVIARSELGVRGSGAVSTSDLRPVTCVVIDDGLWHIQRAGLLDHSVALGQRLAEALPEELVRAFPAVYAAHRGAGVLHGVELTDFAAARIAALRTALIRAGVYVEFMAGAGKRSRGLRYVNPAMRVAPPLVTTTEQVERIVERLRSGTERFLDSL